jgi:hypothetical protein
MTVIRVVSGAIIPPCTDTVIEIQLSRDRKFR